MSTAVASGMTLEEFAKRYHGRSVELVEGSVKELPMAGAIHGYVGLNVGAEVRHFVRTGQLGRTMGLDTFVLTRRNPDTVRGADVAYWSYERFPKEREIPDGVIEIAPNLVIEVRSPSDRWSDVYAKVVEYLVAGVTAVVVLDPATETASVFRNDELQQIFDNGDELTLPDVLPGFSVPVRRLFES